MICYPLMNPTQKVSFILLLLLVAGPAQASVQITEIMYDVSGTDTGREWIELTNTGSGALDVSSFKLFEANTNHALSLVAGTGVLQPGSSAIIADDATKFKIDWPSYSGVLFDSSFSLSNTGESLAIKDSSLEILDSITYDGAIGAAGDGNSLQRSGATLVAASPTPGSYSQGAPDTNTGDTESIPNASTTETTAVVQSPQASGNAPAPLAVHLRTEEVTLVGGGSFFEAKVFGAQSVPLPARIIWNFGDGSTAEGARVFHAYHYPGKYVVTAVAAYNFSSGMARATQEAVAAAVSLHAESDGSLLVVNESKQDLDIGLWSLLQGEKFFVIPEDTVVLEGEGVRFAPVVTGLYGDPKALLRYPNDAVAASAKPGVTSVLRGQRVPAKELPADTAPPIKEPAIDPGAPALPADKPVSLEASQLQAAVAGGAAETSSWWWPVLVLAVVLAVGTTGAWYVQTRANRLETSLPEEEFDIE